MKITTIDECPNEEEEGQEKGLESDDKLQDMMYVPNNVSRTNRSFLRLPTMRKVSEGK